VTVADAALEGSLVRLRLRTEEDIPLFVRWYSDPEVLHWLHLSEGPEQTTEVERQRFEATERDPTRLTWIIETRDGAPIGSVGLLAIEETHKRAELGISIGEKSYWGRGYGTDAIRVALRFAFQNLGLRRVTLITDADNERGIRCYEKCGFVKEGVLRGHRLRHGEPLDMLAMAVLAEEV
jgi:RimJ/RimL family protein N-acetyltransferase